MRSSLRKVSKAMLWIAGFSLVGIMFLTVADVILRAFKLPITGTYEMVGFMAAWAIGFALPQTSLDKVHVVMDFMSGKLPCWANKILLLLTRVIGLVFFLFAAYNLFGMGRDLMASGEETALRHLPLYPLPFGIAFSCLVVSAVLASDLFEKEGVRG